MLIRHLKIKFNPSTSALTFIADKIDLDFECPLRLIQILGKNILDIFDKCTSVRAIVQAICNADQSSMIFHLPDKRTYVSVILTFDIAYGLNYCM